MLLHHRLLVLLEGLHQVLAVEILLWLPRVVVVSVALKIKIMWITGDALRKHLKAVHPKNKDNKCNSCYFTLSYVWTP